MRRISLTAATALAALACALLPSGALAHGHHGHFARRARHHRRGPHSGLFGSAAPNGSRHTGNGGKSGSTPSGTQGTENVGPTSDTQQGNAGKIVSFTEGVLTIELGEGENATKISGKVTEATEIHCIPAQPAGTSPTTPMAHTSDSGGWADGESGQSDGERSTHDDDQGAGDDQNGDRDEDGGEQAQCSTANLTPGTTVHRAELLLAESGAVFREIELVH